MYTCNCTCNFTTADHEYHCRHANLVEPVPGKCSTLMHSCPGLQPDMQRYRHMAAHKVAELRNEEVDAGGLPKAPGITG